MTSDMPTSVAVMQPTFFPWLGYFALIDSVDIFVLLDDVQFTTTGNLKKNRIKTANGSLTISIPCTRGVKPICDVRIASTSAYDKLLRTISQSYAKAPHAAEIISMINRVFEKKHKLLSELNCELIIETVSMLNIDTKLVRASDLSVPKMEKGLRLIKFCEKLNVTQYISVPGTLNYLKENNPFADSEFELKFFSFEHPTYLQLHGPFLSHMAAIDVIANIGPSESIELMRSGVNECLDINQARKLYLG